MDAYANYDALYWDAIGDQWNVPIGRATVRVTAPTGTDRRLLLGWAAQLKQLVPARPHRGWGRYLHPDRARPA